jgi:poly(3-hydroxybutyrate) depolymerase
MEKVFLTFFCLFVLSDTLLSGKLENVKVKTSAPENKSVTVWYRVPDGYDEKSKQLYRVLIVFGGRNSSGKGMANGGLNFGSWANKNKIFLVFQKLKAL